MPPLCVCVMESVTHLEAAMNMHNSCIVRTVCNAGVGKRGRSNQVLQENLITY